MSFPDHSSFHCLELSSEHFLNITGPGKTTCIRGHRKVWNALWADGRPFLWPLMRPDGIKSFHLQTRFLDLCILSCRGRGDNPLSQADIRRMRHDLSLLSEADFRIVLAQAEKSRPGFVSFLFGDSARYEATNQAIRSTFV